MKKFLILILLSVLMVMLFTNCEQEKKEQVSEDMFQQIAMLPGDAEAIAYWTGKPLDQLLNTRLEDLAKEIQAVK